MGECQSKIEEQPVILADSPSEHQESAEPSENQTREKLEQFIRAERTNEKNLQKLCNEKPSRKWKPLCGEAASSLDKRSLRVFLSSTFRDFSNERERMANACFPDIHAECARRGVNFAPIDLRWGVTAEQSSHGRVIDICLSEIDRCRPWFLGFLGFRNGWSLANNPNDTLLLQTFDKALPFYPWIQEFRDRSVTELEILHGSLLPSEESQIRCVFYMRTVDALRSMVLDTDDPERALSGAVDFSSNDQSKLMDLKQRIMQSGHRIRWFDSVEDLVLKVKQDLLEIIQLDFPHGSNDPLSVEINAHQSFSALHSRVYAERTECSAAIQEYLSLGGVPLLITGESGVGKTSLLSHTLSMLNSTEDSRTTKVIARFVGATKTSSTVLSCLRSIGYELAQKDPSLRSTVEMCENNTVLPSLLSWISQSGWKKCIIIISGIDKWPSEEQSILATQVCRVQMPREVRMLLSCDSGANFDRNVSDTAVQKYQVQRLSALEVSEVSQSYLAEFGKVLDESQKKLLLDCELCRLPWFLRAFLGELKQFGSFEKLTDTMRDYLDSDSVAVLLKKVMSRIESDLGCENLALNILGLLLSTEVGLLETELTGCLEKVMGVSKLEKTFPTVEFVSVINQLGFCVASVSGGFMRISHSVVRDSALGSSLFDSLNHFHWAIVGFFSGQSIPIDRRIATIPVSLSSIIQSDTATEDEKQRAEKELCQFFSERSVMECLSQAEYSARCDRSWRILEKRSKELQAWRVYRSKLESYLERGVDETLVLGMLESVGVWLSDCGRIESGTEWFLEESVDILQHSEDDNQDHLEETLFELAKLYDRQKRFVLARETYEQCLEILPSDRVSTVLTRKSSLAGVLCHLDHVSESIALFKECIRSRESMLGSNHPLLGVEWNNLATLQLQIEQYDEAEQSCEQAMNILRDNFGPISAEYASALQISASVKQSQSKYSEALEIFEKALQIKVNSFGTDNHPELSALYTNIGVVCIAHLSLLNRAEECFEKAIQIEEHAFGEQSEAVAMAHMNLASALERQSDIESALKSVDHWSTAAELWTEQSTRFVVCHSHAALIEIEKLDLRESAESRLRLIDESSLQQIDWQAQCAFFHSSAALCTVMDDFQSANQWLDREFLVRSEHLGREHLSCARVLRDKVTLLIRSDEIAQAWQTLREQWSILTMLNEMDPDPNLPVSSELADCLSVCSSVMYEMERFTDCAEFLQNEIEIRRRIGVSDDQLASLLETAVYSLFVADGANAVPECLDLMSEITSMDITDDQRMDDYTNTAEILKQMTALPTH